MKMVKMFDHSEIEKAIKNDFWDYWDTVSNDTAESWFVVDPTEYDKYPLTFIDINDYLLANGANSGETVYIWFSW